MIGSDEIKIENESRFHRAVLDLENRFEITDDTYNLPSMKNESLTADTVIASIKMFEGQAYSDDERSEIDKINKQYSKDLDALAKAKETIYKKAGTSEITDNSEYFKDLEKINVAFEKLYKKRKSNLSKIKKTKWVPTPYNKQD